MSRMDDSHAASTGEASATGAMREKASEVAGGLRDMGTHVKDAAVEQYENLRDTASEYYDVGREKARQWTHDLQNYVQEQPIKSLLIAAGVGVLLGIIWKKS